MSWTIKADFGSGLTDISSDCEQVKRTRRQHTKLVTAIDQASFVVNDQSQANNFLNNTDISIEIDKDGSPWFRGTARNTYNVSHSSGINGLKVEVTDKLYTLRFKKVDTAREFNGVDLSNPSDTGNSVLHVLLTDAGIVSGDLSLDTLTGADYEVYYSVDGTEDITYWKLICEIILPEFGYVLYQDESGTIQTYDLFPSSISTTGMNDGNLLDQSRYEKEERQYSTVDVVWHPTVDKTDILLWRDMTGQTSENEMNVSLADTEYYPVDCNSNAWYARYKLEDYEIIATSNRSLVKESDGTVNTITFTPGTKRAQICLQASGAATLKKLRVRGDATLRDLVAINHEIRTISGGTGEYLTVRSALLVTQSQAQRLASGLAHWHDKAIWVFRGLTDSAVEVGDYIQLDSDTVGVDVTMRVTQTTETDKDDTIKIEMETLESVVFQTDDSYQDGNQGTQPADNDPWNPTGTMTYDDDQDGYDEAGGTTTPTTPSLFAGNGIKQVKLRWDYQNNLTNLDHYELQVSENQTDWYALGEDGSDWKSGSAGDWTETYATEEVHNPIPLSKVDNQPVQRTLYYRVRRATKAGVKSSWSNESSANAYPVTGGDIGKITVGDSIISSNYAAGSDGWAIFGDGTAEFQSITARGTIKADAGYIGNWDIESGEIRSADDSIILDSTNKRITINDEVFGNAGLQLEFSTGTAKLHVGDGTKYLKFDGTDFTWNAGNTSMDATGALTASSATITGEINADSGTFSGVTIDGTLTMGAGGSIESSGYYLLNDSGLEITSTSGYVKNTAGNFVLDNNGITATAGEIGGFSIGSSTLSATNFTLNAGSAYMYLGSNDQLRADAGKARWMVWDSTPVEKVSIGYFDDTLTDPDGNPYSTSDYGIYVASGAKAVFQVQVDLASGDLVQRDGSIQIKNASGNTVLRMGTDSAIVGYHMYDSSGNLEGRLYHDESNNRLVASHAAAILLYNNSGNSIYIDSAHNTLIYGHCAVTAGHDFYSSSGAFITHDIDGAFSARSGSNIDHIWHEEGYNIWHICSDTSYKAGGNSTLRLTKIQFNDTTTYLEEAAGGSIEVNTPSGYVQIGPQTTWHSNFNTDRGSFYFNKKILAETELRVYNVNTYMQDGIIVTDGYVRAGTYIIVGSTSGRISGADSIELYGSTSSGLLSTEDGNGRLQLKWNATRGTSETYLVSSEPAFFWDIDIAADPMWAMKYASGGTAGNAISWTTLLELYDTGKISTKMADLLLYDGNIVIGWPGAGGSLTTGHKNLILGADETGKNTTTGSQNIMLGYKAGQYLSDGTTAFSNPTEGIYIGKRTKTGASSDYQVVNEVVIGYNATGHEENTITIGSLSYNGIYLEATHAYINEHRLVNDDTDQIIAGAWEFQSKLEFSYTYVSDEECFGLMYWRQPESGSSVIYSNLSASGATYYDVDFSSHVPSGCKGVLAAARITLSSAETVALYVTDTGHTTFRDVDQQMLVKTAEAIQMLCYFPLDSNGKAHIGSNQGGALRVWEPIAYFMNG